MQLFVKVGFVIDERVVFYVALGSNS